MNIGIIGAGAIGSNVARLLAKNGIPATISNSRGTESLRELAGELGPMIKAGTPSEAARAEIVLVAVRWVNLQAITALGTWHDRIVIDATNAVEFLDPNSPASQDSDNPLAAFGIKAIDLGGRHSSEVFREFVPGARVVKAFNHLEASLLPEPRVSGGRRVLFYSGDDADGKTKVRGLIEQTGYFPIDLGALDGGGRLSSLPFGALATVNLIKV